MENIKNKDKNIWDNLINQYSLSKTLRFELKPISNTTQNIEKLNLVKDDEEKSEDYKKVKEIIDEYHKDFIENFLSTFSFDIENLKLLFEKVKSLESAESKNRADILEKIEKIQGSLRKEMRKCLDKNETFKDLFSDKLIKSRILYWLESEKGKNFEENKKLVEKFKNWTTYFTGFNNNRKNVYSVDKIPTSIIHRIVHDNLIKFLKNICKFETLKNKYFEMGLSFRNLEDELKEHLNGKNLNYIFSLENFNNCLSQKEIDDFNIILSGKSIGDGKKKIKGLNEYINLFSQSLNENKNESKRVKNLKMIKLFKQILSDSKSFSYITDKIQNDKECINLITEFYKEIKNENFDILIETKKLLSVINEYNKENIYIKNDERILTSISQFIFKDFSFIQRCHKYYCEKYKFSFKNKEKKTQKEIKEVENYLKKTNYFSIKEVETSIERYIEEETEEIKKEGIVCDYFSKFEINGEHKNKINILEEIEKNYKKLKYSLSEIESKNKLSQDEESILEIKKFLDSIMSLFHFLKPLSFDMEKKEKSDDSDFFEKDMDFYSKFEDIFDKLKNIISLYNKVRNYITQKSYNLSKFKLNFSNQTLGNGWDLNKEEANSCVILKDKNIFYLGIINQNNKKVFQDIKSVDYNEDYYEKMEYKLLPGANKMLPKVFFSDKNLNIFNPSDEINRIRNEASHTKSGKPKEGFEKKDFNLSDCHKMIDFFKESIKKNPDWEVLILNLKILIYIIQLMNFIEKLKIKDIV